MANAEKGKRVSCFPDDYTVVDIETTGLSTTFNEIIEISAIKVRGGKVMGTFSSLIKPVERINGFIENLTGITNEIVKDAPCAESVLKEFYDFAGADILVGHNVSFDVGFLYVNLLEKLGLAFSNCYVDTLFLARKALPNLVNHKQVTVATYYGIETSGSHRALRDCEICNACYVNLKKALTIKE